MKNLLPFIVLTLTLAFVSINAQAHNCHNTYSYCICKTGWFSDSYSAYLVTVDSETGQENESLIRGSGSWAGDNAKENCEEEMNKLRVCR